MTVEKLFFFPIPPGESEKKRERERESSAVQDGRAGFSLETHLVWSLRCQKQLFSSEMPLGYPVPGAAPGFHHKMYLINTIANDYSANPPPCEIKMVHPVPEKESRVASKASEGGGRKDGMVPPLRGPSVLPFRSSAPSVRRTAFRAPSNRRPTATDQLNNCRLSGNHLRPRPWPGRVGLNSRKSGVALQWH